MATAVKPLRLDGRSSAANVEVCGRGARRSRKLPGGSMATARGRRNITTASNRGSTRSKNSAGKFLTRDSNCGHRRQKGHLRATKPAVAFSGDGAKGAGDDQPRSRSAVLRRPSAARLRRSPPPKTAARHQPDLASPRTRSRPCGFSRHGRGEAEGRGSERSERAQRRLASPRSPQETPSFFADRRTAYAEKHQTTTNHIFSRGRKSRRHNI